MAFCVDKEGMCTLLQPDHNAVKARVISVGLF